MKISIVSPVYYGEKLVSELVNRLEQCLPALCDDFEIILVEDGSPDKSWEAVEEVSKSHPKVKGVKLSRNFGQHNAITAGLSLVTGDWVVVMDCDLQDQPEEIGKLLKKTQEGYDIVFAQRIQRQDGILKRASSKLFYRIFGYLTDTHQDPSIANFGIYRKEAIDALLSMKDYIRYFPTMVQWVGFDATKVAVNHSSREEGKSTYTLRSLIKLATSNMIAFSDKPLRLTAKLGIFMSFSSFIIGLIYMIQYFRGVITVLGFSSIIITIFFLSGLIIFILGIIGIYLGKTFEQVKERPNFIVHKTTNFDN